MTIGNIVGITASQIFGDFGFKDFVDKGAIQYLFRGVLGYAGIIFFFLRALRVTNILWINAMWSGGTIIFESLAAFILLRERFHHKLQYAGLVAIAVGMFFLKYFDLIHHSALGAK